MSRSTCVINPGVMGRQKGWHHEPWIYKACPNKAVTSFLFLHKLSVWNCLSYLVLSVITLTQRKQIWRASSNKLLECAFVPARDLTGGDTHILCVACLGEEHAQSALEGTDCEHCDVLPLQTLRSRLAFFHKKDATARVPRGYSPGVRKWICQRG